MYLEIDEGFDEHPKTVRLCRAIGDINAGQYLFRLWRWASRCAKDGDLSGMDGADLESIMRYAKADGKLFAALTEKWSPKFGPWIDSEGGRMSIHGWDERQGKAIARLEKNAACMRDNRDKSKASREHHVSNTCTPRDAHVMTRPVQSSQDQSREDPDPDQLPTTAVAVAVAEVPAPPVPPPNEPGKPTPFSVVSKYLTIRAEILGAKPLFAQPQPSDLGKAQDWLAGMFPEDCSDIEPAIRLACKHVQAGDQGWTNHAMAKVGFLFGCIVRSWPDLREEIHHCAPRISGAPPGGVNPVKAWRPAEPMKLAPASTASERGWPKQEKGISDLVSHREGEKSA